jgi:hypothetical protein
VNDRSIALLTSRFYGHLQTSGAATAEPPMPPHHALSKAQRCLATATAVDL